ncbi:MAG: hypothetical protein JKY27_09565 [Magnetovibrio sp.]|nr:hypothetical protein [Magnetovibrio sp.]
MPTQKSLKPLSLIISGVLAFMVTVVCGAALANDGRMLVLDAKTRQASLVGHLERLIDPDGVLDIKAVSSDHQASFEHLKAFRSGGYTSDVHWYRFTVIRSLDAPAEWVLDLGEPYLNEIDIFLPTSDTGFQRVQLGDHVAMAGRALPGTRHALPLTLPEGQPVTIHIRVATNSSLSFNGTIWHPNAFSSTSIRSSFYYGTYLGGLGILIFIYFIFGIC